MSRTPDGTEAGAAATPEGHTPEAPGDELSRAGTPGAGMTPSVPHPADAELVDAGAGPADPAATVAHHDAVTHMDAHTALSDDDHGHVEPRLGPIDWPAWGYAVLGVALGAIIVALFYVAIS